MTSQTRKNHEWMDEKTMNEKAMNIPQNQNEEVFLRGKDSKIVLIVWDPLSQFTHVNLSS